MCEQSVAASKKNSSTDEKKIVPGRGEGLAARRGCGDGLWNEQGGIRRLSRTAAGKNAKVKKKLARSTQAQKKGRHPKQPPPASSRSEPAIGAEVLETEGEKRLSGKKTKGHLCSRKKETREVDRSRRAGKARRREGRDLEKGCRRRREKTGSHVPALGITSASKEPISATQCKLPVPPRLPKRRGGEQKEVLGAGRTFERKAI